MSLFTANNSLQPPRIAAIPGAILDIIVKDELKQDTSGKQQEGTTVTPLATPPQPRAAITIPNFRRNPTFGDELAALENYNHIDPPSNFLVRRNTASGSVGVAMDSDTHIEQPHAATARRNPAYGDELAALENYNHIDIPNTSARGPQFIPENSIVTLEDSLVTQQEQQHSSSIIKGTPQELHSHPDKRLILVVQPATPSNLGATTPRLGDSESNANDTTRPVVSRRDTFVVDISKDKVNAQFLKGLRFENGRDGVQQDYGVAMKCYLRAAEQGYLVALYNIGLLYELGKGVAQNESKARELYVQALEYSFKAAERGDVESQYVVGRAYESGRGVPKDEAKAMEWYAKAADQGKTGAMFRLRGLKNKHP